MDKKSIAILLVTTSFASSAFATNIVDKLIAKQTSATHSMTKIDKTTKQANDADIDFSGTWIGKCSDGQTVSTVIENGADYINLDGDVSRIGRGLQGRYHSDQIETVYNHDSFEWNNDGSALIMQNVSVVKDNTANTAIDTLMSTFSLTMKNAQLNLDGRLTVFEYLTQTEQPYTFHCVLSKKQ